MAKASLGQNAEDAPNTKCGLHIDLVVPCFNEEASAPILLKEIEIATRAARKGTAPRIHFGIIIINDGSLDNTKEVFANLLMCSDFAGIILDFSRNFGKEAALRAGLEYSRGDACIILDADLQDPPSLINQMIDAWQEGYEVVNAVRSNRSSDNLLKRCSAQAFYAVFSRLSHLNIQYNASDFRLLDKAVIKAILRCPERVRFSKGFFSWAGFKQVNIYFERPQRVRGATKWGEWSLWNYALDGIFSFSTAPLRVWSYIGGITTLASASFGIFVVARTLVFGIDVPGYASIMLVVTLMGGLMLTGLGIIGEYIGRIYMETKRRPHYIMREVIRTYPK